MLQTSTRSEAMRRNLTLAIACLRSTSSVRAQDAVTEISGRHILPFADSKQRLCSYGSTRICFQCSSGGYCRDHVRISDYVASGSSNGRRPFSSAIAEEPTDQTSNAEEVADQTFASAEPQIDALQKYLKVVQVSEVLETHSWDHDTSKLLEDLDIPLTADMVVRVIRAVSSPTSSLGFFNWVTLKGFEQDVSTYGAMLDMLGKAGSIDEMKNLTEEMRRSALAVDSGLYDRLIHWCVCHGDASGASSLLEKGKEEGMAMSASTYTSMLRLYVKEGKFEDAVMMYLQMVEEAVRPSSDTIVVLIRFLLEAGKLDLAQTIFSVLPGLKVKPLPSMYAYLMAAHAKVGNVTMLQSLGKEIRNSCSRPGELFRVALSSLQKEGRIEEADAFSKEVWPELSVKERRAIGQDVGLISDLDVSSEDDTQNDYDHLVCADRKVRVSLSDTVSLLETEGIAVMEQLKLVWTPDAVYKVLTRCSSSDTAWEFFKWLKSIPGFMHDLRNEICMLRTLLMSLKLPLFKDLLCDMQSNGANLSLETFNILIKECVLVKNGKAAMWVYSRMKESNLKADGETFSNLVHAFARGRNPDKASDLCSVMQDVGINPDVETYTAVIHSLGLAGRSDDAWSFYQRMLATGLKPNAITYTSLINMMNCAGDTDFAIKIFKEMNDNGVSPTEATQGIMAGIYEAAGDSAEAQNLETQRKFLSAKRVEDLLRRIYEVLLEGLVEQERSPSLACEIR